MARHSGHWRGNGVNAVRFNGQGSKSGRGLPQSKTFGVRAMKLLWEFGRTDAVVTRGTGEGIGNFDEAIGDG
jgi:hypothetical protein